MAKVTLSRLADSDLGIIADYTIETFGVKQARRYRDGFNTCFQTLAEAPLIGRAADYLAEGLRAYPHRSHVIFYQQTDRGIYVVRVFHQSMDFQRHF